MEITEKQHPDSIWTWASNKRGARVSVWVPYLNAVEKKKGNEWLLKYNGGEVVIAPDKVDLVMIYGPSGALPVAFIDDLAAARIALLIHRRNIGTPVVFLPGQRADQADCLSQQIRARDNRIRRAYIARTLVEARFAAIADTLSIAKSEIGVLRRLRSIDAIRNWEAERSRRYWSLYFDRLGAPDAGRRDGGPLASALDAGSMFLLGVILRWVLVHKLSPSHAYLHSRSEYMSLIYDLMEPYRYMIELAVGEAAQNHQGDPEALTAKTLANLKRLLDQPVYVPAARQQVRRKNLLHGIVLALRAYLVGDMKRLVVPAEGRANGGRPIKISYRLPGGIAKKGNR